MKSKLLYVSVCLIFLCCSFTFNESKISWMWENKVQVPLILISIAIVLIVTHFYQRRKEFGG